MAFPEDQAEYVDSFPERFGTSGRCHRHLQMKLRAEEHTENLALFSF